jgi:hypothetical protein
MRPSGVGSWLRTASPDDRLWAADLIVLTYSAAREQDLLDLAAYLDLAPAWGETQDSLRSRLVWRARQGSRLLGPVPQPVLRWWASAVLEFPVAWRPALRRAVDAVRRWWAL